MNQVSKRAVQNIPKDSQEFDVIKALCKSFTEMGNGTTSWDLFLIR